MSITQTSLQEIASSKNANVQNANDALNKIQQQQGEVTNTGNITYSGGRIRSIKVSNFSISNIVNTMNTSDGKKPSINENVNNKTVSTNMTKDTISFYLSFDVDNKSSIPFLLPSLSNTTFTIPGLKPINMNSPSMSMIGPNGGQHVTVKGEKDFVQDDKTWGKAFYSVVVLFYLSQGFKPKNGVEVKTTFSTPVYSQSIDANGPTISGPSSYTTITNGTKTQH